MNGSRLAAAAIRRRGTGAFARRMEDIESDTGYDTRRRVPDGALARLSHTTVYDTRVSKADCSQSLDLQRVAG